MDSDVQRHLRRISARQNDLERRLQRIENSAVFRTLRWLGPKLSALGLPVPGVSQIDDASAYQSWIQESAPIRQALISVAQGRSPLKARNGDAILHITGDVVLEPDA